MSTTNEIIKEIIKRNKKAIEYFYIPFLEAHPERDLLDRNKFIKSATINEENALPKDKIKKIYNSWEDEEGFLFIEVETDLSFIAAMYGYSYKVILFNKSEMLFMKKIIEERLDELAELRPFYSYVKEVYHGDYNKIVKEIINHEKGHFKRPLIDVLNESVLPNRPFELFNLCKMYTMEEIAINTKFNNPALLIKEQHTLKELKAKEKSLKKIIKNPIIIKNFNLKFFPDYNILSKLGKIFGDKYFFLEVMPILEGALNGTVNMPVPGLLDLDFKSDALDNIILPNYVRVKLFNFVIEYYKDNIIKELDVANGEFAKMFGFDKFLNQL